MNANSWDLVMNEEHCAWNVCDFMITPVLSDPARCNCAYSG